MNCCLRLRTRQPTKILTISGCAVCLPRLLSGADTWKLKVSNGTPIGNKKSLLRKSSRSKNLSLIILWGGYLCIDIGCGPFPIGHRTDKVDLQCRTLDPLGHVYNLLKKQHNIDDGVSVETGCVELLHELYAENTFDMIHMMNSLDHSFDPFHGLQEMLFVCKVGGKVILKHAENKAVNQKYNGLHQWNLSVHNAENSFVIWSGEKRFDVCKMFSEYADFELYPVENLNAYQTVVIKKKKRIVIPSDGDYYSKTIHRCNYKYLLEILSA